MTQNVILFDDWQYDKVLAYTATVIKCDLSYHGLGFLSMQRLTLHDALANARWVHCDDRKELKRERKKMTRTQACWCMKVTQMLEYWRSRKSTQAGVHTRRHTCIRIYRKAPTQGLWHNCTDASVQRSVECTDVNMLIKMRWLVRIFESKLTHVHSHQVIYKSAKTIVWFCERTRYIAWTIGAIDIKQQGWHMHICASFLMQVHWCMQRRA